MIQYPENIERNDKKICITRRTGYGSKYSERCRKEGYSH